MYKNKKFFVLGMARSGVSVAKLLAGDNEVFITDVKEQKQDDIDELDRLGVKFERLDNPAEVLDESYDYLVKNPGIKYSHECVVKARDLGIPVVNEMEIAYDYLDKSVQIIGITGSNGKTTTTTMVYEILRKYYDRVYLAGNIGFPLSSIVRDIKRDSILVMEVSDHQLCDMEKFKTNVSVLTNISEVHIDFHDSYEKYKMVKRKIFNNMGDDDLVIVNGDNEEAVSLVKGLDVAVQYFSKERGAMCEFKDGKIYYDGEEVLDTERFLVKGLHNVENAMAAVCVAKRFSVDNGVIQEVLNSFKGVEHRLEFVGEFKGRKVFNDSKSTNVESTKIALGAMDRRTVLLLGGLDRGHSFRELTPYMKRVKHVVCYGETKGRIKEFCDEYNFECTVVDELVEAVRVAFECSSWGDAILLSPACASWDQFGCFEERGDLFKSAVRELGE